MSYLVLFCVKLLKMPCNSNYSFVNPPYNKEIVVSLCLDFCEEKKSISYEDAVYMRT